MDLGWLEVSSHGHRVPSGELPSLRRCDQRREVGWPVFACPFGLTPWGPPFLHVRSGQWVPRGRRAAIMSGETDLSLSPTTPRFPPPITPLLPPPMSVCCQYVFFFFAVSASTKKSHWRVLQNRVLACTAKKSYMHGRFFLHLCIFHHQRPQSTRAEQVTQNIGTEPRLFDTAQRLHRGAQRDW